MAFIRVLKSQFPTHDKYVTWACHSHWPRWDFGREQFADDGRTLPRFSDSQRQRLKQRTRRQITFLSFCDQRFERAQIYTSHHYRLGQQYLTDVRFNGRSLQSLLFLHLLTNGTSGDKWHGFITSLASSFSTGLLTKGKMFHLCWLSDARTTN